MLFKLPLESPANYQKKYKINNRICTPAQLAFKGLCSKLENFVGRFPYQKFNAPIEEINSFSLIFINLGKLFSLDFLLLRICHEQNQTVTQINKALISINFRI